MDCSEIASSLETTPGLLRLLLSNITDDVASWHVEPGDWCIKEIIGHLQAADGPAFADRISRILNEEHPTLAVWSAEVAAQLRNDCARPLSEMLQAFAASRAKYASFVRTLVGAPLDRAGLFPGYGALKASDFLNEWFYHDLDHMNQIMMIMRADLWPGFSDNMKRALKT